MENIENTESSIEMQDQDTSTESTTIEGSAGGEPAGDAEKAAAAWESFTAATSAHAQALGLTVKPQAGFVQYLNEASKHKVYVGKGVRGVKRVDTTLPLIGLLAGASELEKPNGRVACHVPADLDTVTEVLNILASEQFGNIPAPKRAKKEQASSEESPAQSAE